MSKQLSKKDLKKIRKLQKKQNKLRGIITPRQRGPRTIKARQSVASAPVSYGNTTRMSAARVRNLSSTSIRVRHSEYVGDITSTTAPFSVNYALPINPGMRNMFPWLYRIANRYESYKIRYLRVRYATESSTSSAGYVVLAIDYDPTDPAPTSKQQVMQYDGSVKSAVWKNASHVSSQSNLSKHTSYFVRSQNLVNSESLGLYDVGNLFLCSGGLPLAGISLGELWVDYEIDFMTPQMADANEANVRSANILGTAAVGEVTPLGTNTTVNFGNSSVFLSTATVSNAFVITFLSDYKGYLTWDLAGSGGGTTVISQTLNGTAVGATVGPANGFIAGGANVHCMMIARIDADAGDIVTCDFQVNTGTPTFTRSEIWIGELAP